MSDTPPVVAPARHADHGLAAHLDFIAGLDVPAWMAQGLCAQTDPEAFYPEKGGSTAHAKQVCLRCDVRIQCLEYALAHEERFGIWGGYSERERRKLKKTGTSAAAAPVKPARPRGRPPKAATG